MNEGVKLHLRAMQAGFAEYETPFDASIRSLEVELPGGSKITALPANPDTARGFSANVLLDEFAFHQDSRAIWRALFPVISKPGLKLRVISTPNGKGNKFFELMTGKDDAAGADTAPISIKPWPMACRATSKSCGRGAGDEDLWAQEFELKWLDEARRPAELRADQRLRGRPGGPAQHYAGGPCYVGVDIGARNDLFVIWVVERVGDVCWTREIIARKRCFCRAGCPAGRRCI